MMGACDRLKCCRARLRVVDADLNCRNWGAIHPCTFHRGAWGTVSLTCLQLEQCNLDSLPYQVTRVLLAYMPLQVCC